ncbi:MAG: YbhN family protein [Gemmatimonadota bacterium]
MTSSPRGSPLSPRRLALGALLFVLFTGGGYALLAWLGGSDQATVPEMLAGARAGPLVAATLLALLEVALGGTRLWILAHHARRDFRWRDGLHTHLYNAFASGVTPAQAGAGPAQYWILRRKHLRPAEAMAVLTLNWIGVLAGFVIFGGAGLTYLARQGEIELSGLLEALLVSALVTAGAAVTIVFFPHRLERVLLARPRVRRTHRGRRLLLAVGRYRRSVRDYGRRGKRAWAANAAVSWTMLLTKSLEGVAVLAALGIPAGTLSALARQALQFAVIYVSPSPGGSGVAELSALGFMAGVVPAGLMLSYAALWRMFTGYLAIALGAIFVGLDLVLGLTHRVAERAAHGHGGRLRHGRAPLD